MAGIGFELQKAVHEDSYLAQVRGYLYAAVISAGPWLLSVVALGVLGIVSAAFLPREATALFAATITHTFAVSLITTGVIQMVVTRYLADELYLERTESVAPTFVAVLALSSAVQFAVINLLFATTNLPLGYRLPAASLYVAVCGIWVAMIFLSAARDYVSIAFAFGIGYLISFLAAVEFGSRFGLTAYLMGFAAGQVVALGLLTHRVFAEFELERSFNLDFLGYFRRFPALVAIGLVYNLALWIDKIVFWFSPEGFDVGGILDIFPAYDTSFFVASITVVPALALFTVGIETDFYVHYKRFYEVIQNRLSLQDLFEAKRGMIRSLGRSYFNLLKIQSGLAFVAAVFLARPVVEAVGLPELYIPLLRVLIVGMSAQVFLLFAVLILLYLDLRGSALIVCAVFLTTNFAFTALTVSGGYEFYGYGFLASSVVSLIVAVALLAERFGKLEYLTFARQPL